MNAIKISKKMNMKTINKVIFSLLFIFFLFYLTHIRQITILSMVLIAVSVSLLIKVRKDIKLVLLVIPITYANYSIAIGEFLKQNLQVSLNSIRFIEYEAYINVLLMITIFTFVFSIFIRPNKNNVVFEVKNNWLIFYTLSLLVFLINIIFFDRTPSTTYIVRGSPLQGYTFLLILFMYYFSGKRRFRIFIILLLTFLIALQSLYFGNRGALISIVIVVLLTVFKNKLSFNNIIIFSFIGIVFLSIIGTTRSGQSATFEISDYIESFRENYFVQDTSVYAFNSSVTHYVAASFYDSIDKVKSFIAFIFSIFIGGNTGFTNYGNVTNLSNAVVNNLGGGLITTHFYFWFGWLGVLLIPYILAYLINKFNKNNSDKYQLTVISLAATSSTWYLYSPLQFFRIIIVFIPLLHFGMLFFDKEMKKYK